MRCLDTRQRKSLAYIDMEIHIARDGRQRGPYPLAEVRRMLKAGEVGVNDLAWTPGAVGWAPLNTIAGVVEAPVAHPPPPANMPPPLRLPSKSPAYVGLAMPDRRVLPTSGLAVTSLVLGIVSLVMMPIITSIPAVICGHLARADIRRSQGTLSGDGLAITGLITGYLGLALWGLLLLFLASLMFVGFKAGPKFLEHIITTQEETESVENARRIAVACRRYAGAHQGAFPEDLEALVPKYISDRSVFRCPLSETTEPIGFEYLGGGMSDPPDKVFLYSKGTNRNGDRVVARMNAEVKLEPWSLRLEAPVPR